MRAKQLLTIAIASTLLFGGVAALGAASPADRAPDTATDAAGENAPAGPDDAAPANGETPDNADGVGPSDGLPEQVPDHVSEIHDRIDSFLNGSIEDLGGSLGELLGNAETAEESTDDGDGEADNGDSDT
jgi:hypothetical protein